MGRAMRLAPTLAPMLSASLAALTLTGCVLTEPPGVSSSAVAVPGPWVAPPRVQAIAVGHFVPVVDPPPVRPAGSCGSTNPFTCSCVHPACTPAHPGTHELREYLLARFPDVGNSGTYCCRQNSNRRDYLSVHAIGRAIDLGVPYASGGGADNTVGDEVANFLVEHAEYIGIQRVIWDHTFWNGERGFGTLGGDPHTNHLHIELSVAGAARTTPFFTVGPPGTMCAVACEGATLVGADCARTDCGASGQQCLGGPAPRCGIPEPPRAVPVAGRALPGIAPVGDPGRLTFTGPDRMFDTRASMSGLTWDDAARELTWRAGLDASVTGVWLNLAAVPTEAGHLSVFPTGATRPGTSNLNYASVRANLVPSPLGGGSLTVFQSSRVDLIGDLYATMGEYGDGLELIDPTRVYDSRSLGATVPGGEVTPIDVGAPAGTTGMLGTIAALRPPANAHVAVFPCGADPETSNVNLRAGEIASAQLVTALADDGMLCVRPNETMHLVIDALGWFSPDGLLEYQALTPRRLVDTRSGVYFENRLAAHQEIELPLGEASGMPENGWAAALNVATIEADGPGHLIAYACERGAPPATSAHNFDVDTRATLVTTDLGTSRRACLTTSTRAHVVVDLLGLWRRRDGAPPPPPEPVTEPTEPGPDGDGGVNADAGAPSGPIDAGSTERPPTAGEGCSCHAAPSRSRWSPVGLALIALALAVARRRRRR